MKSTQNKKQFLPQARSIYLYKDYILNRLIFILNKTTNNLPAGQRGENNMDFLNKHFDKIWGLGIGFVVGFLLAGWASSAGVLTGF